MRLEHQSEIWVLWWFNHNDTPEQRSVLQVHPRGNRDTPVLDIKS